MFDKNLTLNDVDPDIAKVISAEEARQEAHIELIASENYTSPAVMCILFFSILNLQFKGIFGFINLGIDFRLRKFFFYDNGMISFNPFA